MRRKCCVPTCNSVDKCSVCQIRLSYFKAPREIPLIKKWEFALGLKGQSLLPRDRVCSSHFKKSDIITKRFVSLKRPSTNSKIILEISKLERNTVPTLFRNSVKQCNHGNNRKLSHSVESSIASAPASSQSDDTSDSSDDDCEDQQKVQLTRRDYHSVAENVKHRSRRRQIRAFNVLQIKWLQKIRNLQKQTHLLREKICELEMEEAKTYDSN